MVIKIKFLYVIPVINQTVGSYIRIKNYEEYVRTRNKNMYLKSL